MSKTAQVPTRILNATPRSSVSVILVVAGHLSVLQVDFNLVGHLLINVHAEKTSNNANNPKAKRCVRNTSGVSILANFS